MVTLVQLGPLSGLNILLVEDDFFIADEMAASLEAASARIVGPANSVAIALRLLNEAESAPDLAVLDINLDGTKVYPLADELLQRGIPFLFTTGYDAELIPGRFASVVRCQKPVSSPELIKDIKMSLFASRQAG
jgi:CheY-like chemotaxis protein